MELYIEILKDVDFDDKDRFRQMVLETKANMESRIVGGGHSVAASRLDAMNSVAGWVNEQMGGVSYLEYVRDLSRRVEEVFTVSASFYFAPSVHTCFPRYLWQTCRISSA